MSDAGAVGAHFYPRPPRGGRLPRMTLRCRAIIISIHALREEGDDHLCDFKPKPRKAFLSTPSARRATGCTGMVRTVLSEISIHALREEGDPLRPCCTLLTAKFLSTPSARRATYCLPRPAGNLPISIHALREEGDPPVDPPPSGGEKFLSTPSARRATGSQSAPAVLMEPFLSTPSARRATLYNGETIRVEVFLSTPSARRATQPHR